MKGTDNKRAIFVLTIMIGMFLAINTSSQLIINENNITSKGPSEVNQLIINLRTSTTWNLDFIHVDNNWTLTNTTKEWCNGAGTLIDPYVIENVSINAATSPISCGILIENSQNDYFIIRNCTIIGASGVATTIGAIKLSSCENGTIIGNTCPGNVGSGIIMINSNYNNVHANNLTDGSSYGIYIESSHHNNFTDNDMLRNQIDGMWITSDSDNNLIVHNNMSLNGLNSGTFYGIKIDGSSYNNDIINNTINSNGQNGAEAAWGVYIYFRSTFSTIQGNIINDNKDGGIKIENMGSNMDIINNTIMHNGLGKLGHGVHISDKCNIFNIIGNKISKNYHGLWIEDDCDTYTLINNSMINNTKYGLRIFTNCDDFTIVNNTVNRNADFGIFISETCTLINITDSTIHNNTSHGIRTFNKCKNMSISNSIISFNTGEGLWISSNNYSSIDNNTVYNNSNSGVMLEYSLNSTIADNNIHNNRDGITLIESNGTIVERNEVKDNSRYGIHLSTWEGGEFVYCKIWINNITNNEDTGILIDNSEMKPITNNLIFLNMFIGNGMHATDNGLNNKWDNGELGNYWDDYTGSDVNEDCIGDTPYDITGAAGANDNYPLLACWYSDPPSPPPRENTTTTTTTTNPANTDAPGFYGVPGYDIFMISCVICIVSLLLIKKRKRIIK